MAVSTQSEDSYVRRVYRQIVTLALAAHLSHIVIFALLGLHPLAVYNAASALFYCVMLVAVGGGHYRLAVSCSHLEVCLFAVVCTLTAGWDIGIAYYLVAMTSMTYFCPFLHKNVPYLFAALEVCVFLALRLYTGLARPGFLAVSETAGLWMYLYSICSCFTFILFAAFSSKVSAAVSRRELQEENRSLSAQANYDQLTGLLSRRAFLAKLEQDRNGSTVLALGDIDDFKAVNDTWGHPCGDRVLSEMAELIRLRLGGLAEVCRWGGEEFLFLFRGLSLEEVVAKLQDLRLLIAAHTFHCGAVDLHITMTFGVTPDGAGLSAEELVALADRRMYAGKAGGKNQVVSIAPLHSGPEKNG